MIWLVNLPLFPKRFRTTFLYSGNPVREDFTRREFPSKEALTIHLPKDSTLTGTSAGEDFFEVSWWSSSDGVFPDVTLTSRLDEFTLSRCTNAFPFHHHLTSSPTLLFHLIQNHRSLSAPKRDVSSILESPRVEAHPGSSHRLARLGVLRPGDLRIDAASRRRRGNASQRQRRRRPPGFVGPHLLRGIVRGRRRRIGRV